MKKKCKVILLPTNSNQADIYKSDATQKLNPNLTQIDKRSNYTGVKYQHLYILSDEEIKEGDLKVGDYYTDICPNKYQPILEQVIENQLFDIMDGKIIATTNPNLIKEGIASIDNEFIKSYCNNPVEEVSVEYENIQKNINYHKDLWVNDWKIKLSSNGSISIKPVKEKLYTKEDLIVFGKNCFYKGFDKAVNDDANCYTAWREENNQLIENYDVPKNKQK